jgi:hypothetical protein
MLGEKQGRPARQRDRQKQGDEPADGFLTPCLQAPSNPPPAGGGLTGALARVVSTSFMLRSPLWGQLAAKARGEKQNRLALSNACLNHMLET